MVNIHNKKIKNHPVFILTPSMLPSMAAARWLEGVCVWGGGGWCGRGWGDEESSVYLGFLPPPVEARYSDLVASLRRICRTRALQPPNLVVQRHARRHPR